MGNKQSGKKGIKKGFYEVSAPLTATKIHLYASAPEDLDGKKIKIDLTKSLRGKSLVLKMKIKNTGGNLSAIPEELDLAGSYIRRAMRKGIDYAEDSFETETRDAIVRVKPLMATRRKVSRAVLNALRINAKKQLISHLKTRDSEEIFSEIISNKIQKILSQKLKKIYPLALCEIRTLKVIKFIEKTSKKENEEKSDSEKKE